MYFFIFKALRFGVSQAKKRKAKKNNQNLDIDPATGAPYPPEYNLPEYGAQQKPKMSIRSAYTANGTRNVFKAVIEGFLRFLQFVLGLTVIGLYARDVHHQHDHSTANNGGAVRPQWVYAVVTGFLASSTALVYLLVPFVLRDRPISARPRTHIPLFVWECVLCVLWLTAFGIFGKMYIGVYVVREGGTAGDQSSSSSSNVQADKELAWEMADVTRMRHAAWIDLANLTLWAVTAVWASLRWCMTTRRANADRPAVWGDDGEKDGPGVV